MSQVVRGEVSQLLVQLYGLETKMISFWGRFSNPDQQLLLPTTSPAHADEGSSMTPILSASNKEEPMEVDPQPPGEEGVDVVDRFAKHKYVNKS